jgi:pimeloyl-ACP methyl ester carboxylesterase
MFRDLIAHLKGHFRLIAPDCRASAKPRHRRGDRSPTPSTTWLGVIDRFTQALGLSRYAIYIFDFGAPTGLRIASAHPERITAIISQNGNAYEEGLGPLWSLFRKYWEDPSQGNRDACRVTLTPEITKANIQRDRTSRCFRPMAMSWTSPILIDRPRRDTTRLHLRLPHQHRCLSGMAAVLP